VTTSLGKGGSTGAATTDSGDARELLSTDFDVICMFGVDFLFACTLLSLFESSKVSVRGLFGGESAT